MKIKLILIWCIILGIIFYLLSLIVSHNYNVDDNQSLNNYIPPVPTEWKTDNGINVIYYRDKELPIVRASFYIRGSVEETKNPLLLEAMGSLLKSGGTKNYPSEKLNLKLEKLSASLSSSWGGEYGVISFSCLLEDVEELFKIVSDMIYNPSFDKNEIELWKLKKSDAIKRRLDSASQIAQSKYKSLLYKTSNKGYISKIEDVKKISQGDLFKIKEQFVKPNGMYLTIVGPITRKKIDRLTHTYFKDARAYKGNIKKEEGDVKTRFNFIPKTKQIYFMKKDDLNQATVYIVSKGPKIDEKMHVKYAVFSEYLGTGGFSSILMKDLRTKNGLVYSTFGGVFPGIPYGMATIFIETSDDKLSKALKSAENIEKALKHEENINGQTLDEIKKAMLNAEIFKTADFDTLVDRKFTFKFWDFSNDYDRLYRKRVQKFNSQDLVNIGKKYMNLEDSFIVIVASSKALNNLEELLKDNETIFSKYNLNICDVSKDGLCEK